MAKVLVVDDETQVRELLRSALSESGYDVLAAATPAQASAILASNPADLVILDLSFPGASGSTLLKELQQAHPAMPVVVYSGVVTSEMEKQLIRAGAAEVLNKTVDVLVLVRQIGTILRARQRMAHGTGRREKTLLLVDDEASIRQLLREVFETKGYKVIEAASGAQAVGLVIEANPAVALLDVMMPPGMTGLETLPKLLEACPKLGVVMATGQQDEATVKQAVRLGAYGYVLKPFDLLYLELVVLSKLLIAESA